MSDNQPTPDDLARDLDADLAICEAATAGPWEVEECDNDCGVTYHHIYSDPKADGGTWEGVADTYHDDAYEIPSVVVRQVEKMWGKPIGNRTIPPVAGRLENAAFIAAARTGWPAALRRLKAAEAELAWVRKPLLAESDLIESYKEMLVKHREAAIESRKRYEAAEAALCETSKRNAALANALRELVELKDLKDRDGKTPEYCVRQPAAWIRAKRALGVMP